MNRSTLDDSVFWILFSSSFLLTLSPRYEYNIQSLIVTFTTPPITGTSLEQRELESALESNQKYWKRLNKYSFVCFAMHWLAIYVFFYSDQFNFACRVDLLHQCLQCAFSQNVYCCCCYRCFIQNRHTDRFSRASSLRRCVYVWCWLAQRLTELQINKCTYCAWCICTQTPLSMFARCTISRGSTESTFIL